MKIQFNLSDPKNTHTHILFQKMKQKKHFYSVEKFQFNNRRPSITRHIKFHRNSIKQIQNAAQTTNEKREKRNNNDSASSAFKQTKLVVFQIQSSVARFSVQ